MKSVKGTNILHIYNYEQDVLLFVDNLDFIEDSRYCKTTEFIQSCIMWQSGSEKINALVSLLFKENSLNFENIYVYSKSLYQHKYKLLENDFKKVKGFPISPSRIMM